MCPNYHPITYWAHFWILLDLCVKSWHDNNEDAHFCQDQHWEQNWLQQVSYKRPLLPIYNNNLIPSGHLYEVSCSHIYSFFAETNYSLMQVTYTFVLLPLFSGCSVPRYQAYGLEKGVPDPCGHWLPLVHGCSDTSIWTSFWLQNSSWL